MENNNSTNWKDYIGMVGNAALRGTAYINQPVLAAGDAIKGLFKFANTNRTLPNGETYETPTSSYTNNNKVVEDSSKSNVPSSGYETSPDQAMDDYDGLLGDYNGGTDSGTSSTTYHSPSDSDVTYAINSINNLYSGKSAGDLWDQRQKLIDAKSAMFSRLSDTPYGEDLQKLNPTMSDIEKLQKTNTTTLDSKISEIDNAINATGEFGYAKNKGTTTGTNIPGLDLKGYPNALSYVSKEHDPISNIISRIAKKENRLGQNQAAETLLAKADGNMYELAPYITDKLYSPKDKEDHDSKKDAINSYDSALSMIANNPDLVAGYLKDKKQKVTKLFNKTGDSSYTALMAAFELANAPVRKTFFGTALTSSESSNSDRFLTSKDDTIQNLITKSVLINARYNADVTVGPIMSALNISSINKNTDTNKEVINNYKKVYYDTLNEYANQFKTKLPDVYKNIRGLIPEEHR